MKQYQVIFDSNVLFSALRSQLSASYKLVSLIDGGKFKINLSVPLLFEYESVLKGDVKSSGLTLKDIDDFLDYVCKVSNLHEIFYLWRPFLKDPKDDFVLELAVEAACDCIVTYNKKNFEKAEKFNIKIKTPKEFLKKIGELS